METEEIRLRLTNIENKIDNIQLGIKYIISQIELDENQEENIESIKERTEEEEKNERRTKQRESDE